jgi:small subunit ribosomal protein S1
MSYTKRVHKPSDMVAEGDTVYVQIKGIDLDKRRISLSMKDAEGDPWMDVEEKYAAGQTVQGTVEKREQFGIFINLEPGITGLLPKSVLARSEKAKEFDKLNPGDTVTVTIGQVKAGERKISLSTGDERDGDEWKQFQPKKQDTASSGGFGLLGDKLQEALNKKK